MQTARVRPALHAAPAVLPLPGGQDGATVTLQPLLCGEMRGPAGWFEAEPGLAGALRALGVRVPKHELIRVPIVAFLIEHPTAGADPDRHGLSPCDRGWHAGAAQPQPRPDREAGWSATSRCARSRPRRRSCARGGSSRGARPDRDDAPALRPRERAGGLPRRHGAGLRAGVARGERAGSNATGLLGRPAGPAPELPHSGLPRACGARAGPVRARAGPVRRRLAARCSTRRATARATSRCSRACASARR